MACDQSWSVHEGELDRNDVRALLARHFAAMRDPSPPEACHVMPLDGLLGPEIRFFSLREDGALLGVGALKLLEPGHGEIKSMRADIVTTAHEMVLTRLSLETGSTEDFAAAIRLYQREGFTRCGPFGDYPDSEWTLFFSREI